MHKEKDSLGWDGQSLHTIKMSQDPKAMGMGLVLHGRKRPTIPRCSLWQQQTLANLNDWFTYAVEY